MPIVKIPVTQKFGILSTKYHNELQKKLLEKTKESTGRKFKRKPLEVTEEFIKQFNAAEEVEDQERMLDTARKILHRCKRQSGLHSGHCGNPQIAWTELILMAQCKGNIQEEALEILILSIDQAELNEDHISVLFFIAESVLYRICCDAAQKPCLFSSEVKLSKLGFLTFLRLYTFYLLGHLTHFNEQKSRLSTYLKALPACETTYQPYPNVLSSIHVMLKVGEIICDSDSSLETSIPSQKQPALKDKLSLDSGAAETDTFLWHVLMIWQHTQNNSTDLHDVSKHLCLPKEHLHQENWLDFILALFILGDAAKIDIFCLRALVEIGCDFLSTTSQFQGQASISTQRYSLWRLESIYFYTMVLADVCLHGITSEIQKHAFLGFQSNNAWNMESTEASLNGLLHFNPPNASDTNQFKWIIHYCTVYNLVKICHELHWHNSRDGLRIAICTSLDKWKSVQSDTRVLDAEKIAEVEVNGPTNPFMSAGAKTPSTPESLAFFQHVGCRLASALSQQFLPPVVPYIATPRKAVHRQVPRKVCDVTAHSMEKKTSRLSLRQELLQEGPSPTPPLTFFTRTSMDLQKVMEDQWTKELNIILKEEKEEMKKEEQEKQRKEEDQFKEVMRKREQKLKKTSKPYELPWSVASIKHDEDL
ncbi:transmembrane protein 232 isoform X1 [Bufo bufo]|uniref:transmembrane protein 232 isoform X1 n=2 Tax=Bufo bufo TaxID=8384 RepID=UPI001ABDE62C|nr:transmembrane protein 232 isoform X1 [Bufo bufo]XP_040276137.1 transmembrane protein 232 isoform X1 [Bufo bufo]